MCERPELSALVAELAAGNPQAMQPLYERFAAQLYRFCVFRLTDAEAAHDSVQDVFVLVWHGIRTFDFRGENEFVAWLYTIAGNVVIDQLRKRRRQPSVALTEEHDRRALHGPDMARVVCDRVVLLEAVRCLSRDQQLVVSLRYFAGMSNAEVALVMQRTEGAVKLLHHRAIRRLQHGLRAELALNSAAVPLGAAS